MLIELSNRFSRNRFAPRRHATQRLALAVTAAVGAASATRGADVTSTFNGPTANWSDPTAWTPMGVPNNSNGVTYDAVFNGIYNDSTYQFQPLTLDENINIDHFTMTYGYFAGPDLPASPYTLTLNNALNWSGGIIGNVHVLTTAGGTIAATGPCNLSAGTIENNGYLTFTSTSSTFDYNQAPLTLDSGASILNKAGATFDIAGDNSISVSSGGNKINNDGTFTKSAGTGTAQVKTAYNDTGLTQAKSGTLEFIGGASTHSGTLNASAGATLAFDDGVRTFTPTAMLTGDGSFQFGGNVTFNGTVLGGTGPVQVVKNTSQFTSSADVSAFGLAVGGRPFVVGPQGIANFTTGKTVTFSALSSNNSFTPSGNAALTLTGTDDFVISGQANWTGGIISSPTTGDIKSLTVNAPLTISTGGMALDHRNLFNNSSISVTGGNLEAKDGTIIQNNAIGTFDIGSVNSVSWGPGLTGHSLPSFQNAGLLTKSTNDETDFRDVRLTNTGTVQVKAGTLALYHGEQNDTYFGYTDSGVNSGIYQVDAGATFFVSDHTMDAASTVQGVGTMQFAGGNNSVAGIYNVTGQTTVYGGLAFVAAANVQNAGQLLNITGGGGVTFDTGNPISLNDVIVNGSLGGSDPITITGKLSGAGSITANVMASGTVSPGNSPGILTVQGDLAVSHSTKFTMELGGNSNQKMVTYDVIELTDPSTINGTLSLTLVNGYVPVAGDVLTIFSDSAALSGTFENVAPGGRLFTADGRGSFVVDYGPNSPFGGDSVVLTDYSTVPEPVAGAGILGFAGILLLRRGAKIRGRA